LLPGDFELVDQELTRLLDLLPSDDELPSTLALLRQSNNHQETQQTVAKLRRQLTEHGILVTHPVLSANLIHQWREEEKRLGIEIDARVFAYQASANIQYNEALTGVGGASSNDRHWRFQTIYSLLWPRGITVRSRNLMPYNPFCPNPTGKSY
jgi:hypothetical protein